MTAAAPAPFSSAGWNRRIVRPRCGRWRPRPRASAMSVAMCPSCPHRWPSPRYRRNDGGCRRSRRSASHRARRGTSRSDQAFGHRRRQRRRGRPCPVTNAVGTRGRQRRPRPYAPSPPPRPTAPARRCSSMPPLGQLDQVALGKEHAGRGCRSAVGAAWRTPDRHQIADELLGTAAPGEAQRKVAAQVARNRERTECGVAQIVVQHADRCLADHVDRTVAPGRRRPGGRRPAPRAERGRRSRTGSGDTNTSLAE